MAKLQKIRFKAGDDFSLGMTVTQKTSEAALAAAMAVEEAQLALDTLLQATPQDPAAIATAEAVLESAKDAYQTAITVDISTWEISSMVRWAGKLISSLTVTKTDPLTGRFQISQTAAMTALWKPRIYEIDIQFEINGKKTSSQTFQIDVVRDVTYE